MNWGIKLSTFAVAGLLSVGASAVNFVETGDDLGGMSFDFDTAGTYTIGGSLGSNVDDDSFSFTVGDGFLIESISLDLSNISTEFQAGDFNAGTPADGDEGGLAGTGGGFVAGFNISSLDFTSTLAPDNGNPPVAMGASPDNCGGMGCTVAVGDAMNGMAAAAAMGGMAATPATDGGDETTSTLTTLALGENDGTGPQLAFGTAGGFEAGDISFPLNAGDFDFLLSVLSGANEATGSLDYLLTFEVSAVPLPAAAWLFVSALAGLFGFRRFFSSEAA